MSIKAVIDTNVLVSAFWSGGRETPPFRVYQEILARRFIPLYSEEIIAEYIDVLHRSKFAFNTEEVNELIDIVRTFGEEISPAEPDTEDFPDPDDRVFYCVTLATQDENAVLVTGNVKHFPAAPFIVSPAEFAASLNDL